MRKVLTNVGLLLIMGMMLILLTGCGADKLIATKTTQDDFMGLGRYEEKVEVEFKNDKVTGIEMTYEFEKKEAAEGMTAILNLGISTSEEELEGITVKQKGNKVIMTMDAQMFAEQEGVSEKEMKKEAMRSSLEEDGYTVK